jgi:hypothetical protein
MAYRIPVRLRYVAVAYKNLCTPPKIIPPIAIFLVVGTSGYFFPIFLVCISCNPVQNWIKMDLGQK